MRPHGEDSLTDHMRAADTKVTMIKAHTHAHHEMGWEWRGSSRADALAKQVLKYKSKEEVACVAKVKLIRWIWEQRSWHSCNTRQT
eukprot:4434369-Amphidinium_carterae.2